MKQQLVFAFVLCVIAKLSVGQDCSSSNPISITLGNGNPGVQQFPGQIDHKSCQNWKITAPRGVTFSLILTNLTLSDDETLTLSTLQDSDDKDDVRTTLQCSSSNDCNTDRAFIIQPDKHSAGQANLRLQSATIMGKVGFVATAAVIDSVGKQDDYDSDSKCSFPAWATVAVVFFVFFFLTIMCVCTVCHCRRCCKKEQAVHANCPRFAHHPTVSAATIPTCYDSAIPPPVYKSNAIA